jgi:hypothetical protein
MNQTGWNPPISQFIWVKILLLKEVVGWNLFFFFKKHRFHILHFPNSTGHFTKPTSWHYTKYRTSPDIEGKPALFLSLARSLLSFLSDKDLAFIDLQGLLPQYRTKFSVWFQRRNCWGLCSKLDVGPSLFTLITAGDANGWCPNWPVWSAPSGSSLAKIVEQCAIKNKVQHIHCR